MACVHSERHWLPMNGIDRCTKWKSAVGELIFSRRRRVGVGEFTLEVGELTGLTFGHLLTRNIANGFHMFF